MTELSKRFEQVIKSALKKYPLLPQKTEDGILLGDVLIKSQGNLKYIYKRGELIYNEISLNAVAIKLSEMLAFNQTDNAEKLYKLDQEYSKWFIDSQFMRTHYERSVEKNDTVKADIYWARYQESRALTISYKKQAEQLAATRINIK